MGEVVGGERVALMSREGEEMEGPLIAQLDSLPANVHSPQVELRVGVAALGGGFEVLQSLLVVLGDPVAMHEHVPEACQARITYGPGLVSMRVTLGGRAGEHEGHLRGAGLVGSIEVWGPFWEGRGRAGGFHKVWGPFWEGQGWWVP